ncbi:MAG: serpin family protein [Proteobacteria bacterium]|nr:serpin family protein [Pseudomonadota bacterium]
MKIRPALFYRIILCCIIFSGCLLNTPSQKEIGKSTESLVSGNTIFAISLYRKIDAPDRNLFFSPMSLSTALSMTWEGAGGNTKKEMATVMHLPENPSGIRYANQTLLADINAIQVNDEIILLAANRIWPQKGITCLDTYTNVLKTFYLSDVKTVDYITPALAAREINTWVEEKTKSQIKHLVPPTALNPTTRLVLTNAVYFKGNWQTPFNPSQTIIAPFKTSMGEVINAPMMNLKDTFNYTENDRLKAIELPYAGNTLSMILLLPKDERDFKNLENELSLENLKICLEKLESKKIRVTIPRFKISAGIDLSQTLTGMGMKDAFSPNADFSGIDGTKDLYISAVLHKAFIDVNEKGTEAAAASAVIVARKTAVEHLPVFKADHPFVFMIRENRHGSILFMGRVMNPLEE